MATEEGIFLSRMLEQIMPLISENSGTTAQGVAYSGGHHGDGSASSTPVSIHSYCVSYLLLVIVANK